MLDDFAAISRKGSDAFSRDEMHRATPPAPPGLEGLGQIGVVQSEEQSRRSTPTIPPGFESKAIHTLPVDQTPSRPASRASLKRAPSSITPAVPILPATPTRASTPLRQESKSKVASTQEVATPTKEPSSKSTSIATEAKDVESKPSPAPAAEDQKLETPIKTAPLESASTPSQRQKIESIKPVASETSNKEVVNDKENKPVSGANEQATIGAIDDSQDTAISDAKSPAAALLARHNQFSEKAKVESSKKEDSMNRKAPGKIDITAAVNQRIDSLDETAAQKLETPTKSLRSMTPSVSSRPASPSISSVDGFAKRVAPRTLRLVSTPKAETPSPAAAAAAVAGPAIPSLVNAGIRAPSRNPSIASMHPPGTPTSEHVSDTISMTSASRASSPPPPVSRVGSAPVRAKTKSQQKKDRQLRAKQLEEEEKQAEDAASPSADEPVQEAILSRKKKSKKASAPPKPKATPSAASTRPASPVHKVGVEEEKPVSPVKEVEPEVPETPKQEEPTPSVPDVPESTTPTSLLSEVRNTSSLLSTCLDTFFKPLAQANTTYKASQNIAAIDLAVGRSLKRNPDVNMLPDQVRSMLLNQHALRYGGEDGRIWSRGCVTPGGAHLRHLEQELEDRYIELEKTLRAMPPQLRYQAPPDPKLPGGSISSEFPRFDLEAIKRGYESGMSRGRDANAMEKAVEEGSKKGSFLVGNAEQYINEFVMPVSAASSAAKAGSSTKDIGITPQQALAPHHDFLLDGQPATYADLERALNEQAKQMADKDSQLRKMIKRNRKMMGFTH